MGPATQRIRDDSSKPQISELEPNCDDEDGASAKGGVRSATRGPSGQTAPTIPLTSLTSTITVKILCDCSSSSSSGVNSAIDELGVGALYLRFEQGPLLVATGESRNEAVVITLGNSSQRGKSSG